MENQEQSTNTGHRDKKGRYPVEKPFDTGADRKECYEEILRARGVTSGTHEISSGCKQPRENLYLSRLPNTKTKSSREGHIPLSHNFQCTDRQHEVCQTHQRNRCNSNPKDIRSNALTKVLPMWRRNKSLETIAPVLISYVNHNVRIAIMNERISGETSIYWTSWKHLLDELKAWAHNSRGAF